MTDDASLPVVVAGTLSLLMAALVEPSLATAFMVAAAAVPLFAIVWLADDTPRRLLIALAIPPAASAIHVALGTTSSTGAGFPAWIQAATATYVAAIILALVLQPSRDDGLLILPVRNGWLWTVGAAGVGGILGLVAMDAGGLPSTSILPAAKLAMAPVLLLVTMAMVNAWLLFGPLLVWSRDAFSEGGAIAICGVFTGALFAVLGPGPQALAIGVTAGVTWALCSLRAGSILPAVIGGVVAVLVRAWATVAAP